MQLVIFPRLWGLPSISPFCSKVETYLRMANIAYEPVYCFNPRQGPKHKLPFVIDAGKKIGDSSMIIDYLKDTRGNSVDASLTKIQQARAQAIQCLCEEHFYWAALWSRWVDTNGWQHMQQFILQAKPWPMRQWILKMARRSIRQQICQAGMGRHSKQEIFALAKKDLDALATLLGDQPFILGAEPHSIDACVASFVGASWLIPWQNPITQHIKQHENLLQYYQRMAERFFPELASHPYAEEVEIAA